MAQRRSGSASRSRNSNSDSSSRPRRTTRRHAGQVPEEDEEMDGAPDGDHEMMEEEDDEDEEMEEDYDATGEITRCICGHQEVPQQIIKNSKVPVDAGLFIQCDSCQVWQHGFCVGFMSEEEVPEVYGCEKCKPEWHVITVRPGGKTSQYYPDGAPEHHSVFDEVLVDERQKKSGSNGGGKVGEKKKEKQPATPQQNPLPSQPSTASSTNQQPPTPQRRKSPSPPMSEKEAARSERRRITLNSRDAAYEETLKRVLEESAHDLEPKPNLEPDDKKSGGDESERKRKSPESDDRAVKRAKRTPKARKTPEENSKSTPVPEEPKDTKDKDKEKEKEKEKEKDKEGSSTTAKETNNTNNSTPSKRKRTKATKRNTKDSASSKLMQQNTESKPRIPPPRSTIPELRKRVAAILEFVGRTRQDSDREMEDRKQLLTERNDRFKLLNPEVVEIDESKFRPMFDHYHENLGKLDQLSSKLSNWETKYGQFKAEEEDD